MLTAFQCEVIAYWTEDGLVCAECATGTLESEGGDAVAGYTPVIRYSLDEEQTAEAEEYIRWDDADDIREEDGERFALIGGVWHVEACACAPALYCADDSSHELLEAYTDYQCKEVEAA